MDEGGAQGIISLTLAGLSTPSPTIIVLIQVFTAGSGLLDNKRRKRYYRLFASEGTGK